MAEITHEVFVEGKRDGKFIRDLIEHLTFDIKKIKITKVGGWHEIQNLDNAIAKNHIEQPRKKSIIILDVDSDFESRRTFLENFRTNLNLHFEYFLIPNNNTVGNIETLLEMIMRPDKSGQILECFDNYYHCRHSAGLRPPQIKSKIFAYLDAYGKETNNEKIDFLDSDMWDLEHPCLTSLKDFLNSELQ